MKMLPPRLRSRRPSAALIVSVFALLVALGGTSYAAVKIQTRDIAQGAVTSAKIKNETIGSNDVRDGSLRARDFGGALPAGPEGPRGPQGPAGVSRWALVDSSGAIVAQSGGFTVTTAYPTLANTAPDGQPSNALRANGNVYINAGEDLSDNGIIATVALQNTVDLNGDTVVNGRAPGADANPEFSGEIAVSQCGTPITACAPAGTGNTNHLVVSPRNSDGSPTTDGQRKRFYVIVTGDSTDPVTATP